MPGSLSPLQDETPGRAKHSRLGQSKNIEDTAMEETGGPCLVLPHPPQYTHTVSHPHLTQSCPSLLLPKGLQTNLLCSDSPP